MKKFIILAVSLLYFLDTMAQIQPLNTQSIAIFKNGQAFYIKSGILRPVDGKFLLPDPAPQALYGTLWFNSPDGSLTGVASYPDTLQQKITGQAVAIWDLLRNNTGKLVTGFVDEKGTVTGSIISVSPAFKNERGDPQFSPQSLVTLQSVEQGWITIPAGQIRYVSFNEKPNLDITTPNTIARHLVEVSFNNAKKEQPIDMMYLANGLNWAPQYLLELLNEKNGTLTLQAEVTNDTEDIHQARVNLVVGVPNFSYANQLARLVDFLQVVQPFRLQENANANPFSNVLMSQQIGYGGDAENMAGPTEPESSRNEDLFFYTLKNFSLPKGGRSMQTIFKEDVEIVHIYECRLPGNDENTRYFEPEFLFTPQVNKVFHTLRLENKTSQPWTTASILVMNAQGERRPVSQDLLTYTPAGGKTFVKLTEALDVKVEHAERELSRKSAAWTDKRRGYTFDLVQVEGKIKVKNFKDKQLDLRLQRTITGSLQETSTIWLKEEIVNPNNPRNRRVNVCWETPVKANSELEIVYTYEVYLPVY